MIVFTLTKGFRVAFGHFNSNEIVQMESESWRVESVVELKFKMPQTKKKRAPTTKRLGVNKNGIPVMQ